MSAPCTEVPRPRRARPGALAVILLPLLAVWLIAAHGIRNPVVVSISILPATAVLGPGGTQQFQVTASMSDGTTTQPSVTWTSTGGTITTAGLYTAGNTKGGFRVIARLASGTLKDTATVTVSTDAQDRIVLQQNDAVSGVTKDETIVYVDAQFKSDGTDWRNDERAPTSLAFANLWPASGGKKDEIVVFSVDDPMTIDQGPSQSGKIWSEAVGEERKVPLAGALPVVPLTIYLLVTPVDVACSKGSSPNSMGCDILNLAVAYNLQRVGLAFDVVVKDLRGDSGAGAVVGCDLAGASYCWCLQTPPTSYYDHGRLNVYVVGSLKGNGMGQFCANAGEDRNSIYLSGAIRGPFLLAHEIGHALNLWHTSVYLTPATPSGWPSGVTDLMDPGAGEVPTLTMGQAFRANVLPWSWVNLHNVSTGTERECEPSFADSAADHVTMAVKDGACPRISHPW